MTAGPTHEQRMWTARQQYNAGRLEAAIDTLRHALAWDPDDPEAHALLAACLVDLKRMRAAEHEAGLALAGDPMCIDAHRVMALVLRSRQKLSQAEEHARTALGLDASILSSYLILGTLLDDQNRRDEVVALSDELLSRFPASPDAWAWAALVASDGGDYATARQRANEAMALDPESIAAHRAMATVCLAMRDLAPAREHIIELIRRNPDDDDALVLLAAWKASSNPLLSPWWRLSWWMMKKGEAGEMAVILGSFIVYRVIVAWAQNNGNDAVEAIAQYVWFGIVVWSWTVPAVFFWMVRRELQKVELRSNF